VNLGVLILVLFAVAVITLLISHKVAGPLYRLGQATEKIAVGDLTGSFRLRTSDELKGLASSFEEMNRDLKAIFGEIRQHAEQVDGSATKLFEHYESAVRNGMGVPRNSLTGRKIEELSKSASALGESLLKFKMG
jgi:nitrogen fixation/metabolism regulation signal transduction histidine kinase